MTCLILELSCLLFPTANVCFILASEEVFLYHVEDYNMFVEGATNMEVSEGCQRFPLTSVQTAGSSVFLTYQACVYCAHVALFDPDLISLFPHFSFKPSLCSFKDRLPHACF